MFRNSGELLPLLVIGHFIGQILFQNILDGLLIFEEDRDNKDIFGSEQAPLLLIGVKT
jgi:hypothetical protein